MKIIDTLTTGLRNRIGWLAEHGVLFLVFAVIWVAFGAALILVQGSLDQAWRAAHIVRGLNGRLRSRNVGFHADPDDERRAER